MLAPVRLFPMVDGNDGHGEVMQARQQRQVMAEFGSKALQNAPLPELLTDACKCLVRGLGVEHAKVLQYQPTSDDLLIVAGIGWAEGVVGHATLPATLRSPPGNAYRTGEPVYISDLRQTKEFEYSRLLRDHGVVALVNVPICTADFTFGVLEADGNTPRQFSEDEKNFLVGFANLIAAAVRKCNADAEKDLLVRELRHAQELAEAALVSNKRLVAATGHDLSQPVQAILLLLEQLERQVADPGPRQMIERAIQAALRLRRDLDQLLTVAQIERSAFEPRLVALDIGPLLTALVDEFRIVAEPKGLAIRYVGSGLRVTTDAHLFEHIMRNLLSNAVKFTGEGRILVGCRRRGDHVEVQVHDTGIGIAADDLEKIFAEFERLNPNIANGRGLGLAIAKQMADLLGQRVGVRSRPGRGTCFSIIMPRA